MSKILFVFLLIFACSGGGNPGGDDNGGAPDPPSNIIPSNLTFNVQVVGSDSDNPMVMGVVLLNFLQMQPMP